MKYSVITTLLVCALLAFSTLSEAQSTAKTSAIKLGLFADSNLHWIALNVQDGSMDTIAVQMRDSSAAAEWADMKFVDGWAHWVVNSDNEYVFPLSFRLTSKAEQEIVVNNIISQLGAQDVDTGIQYSAPKVGGKRKSGHGRVTKAPTTQAPSTKPTTKPVTPTTKPVTPTTKPVTPTTKPVTPTSAPTSAPSAPGSIGMLVPLYTYPGSTWDIVAASASVVKTVAIINPNSGPGTGPDSTYLTYMKKMQTAGVDLIGYVHTTYGARAMADVKADIALYASEFPEVVGIFIDEAAATADQVAYYTEVHQYIMSMPGYKYNVINPGTAPVQGYYSISTQIVSFEDVESKFANSANPTFASASNSDHFSVISYSATSGKMTAGIASAKSKGYYGWVYFTDKPCCAGTYNSLPSYYSAMATAVAAANK